MIVLYKEVKICDISSFKKLKNKSSYFKYVPLLYLSFEKYFCIIKIVS